MAWRKKGKCRSFEEYVSERTGRTIDEISSSGKIKYECPGINRAAAIISDAIRSGTYIGVITDYDADGINSAAEMYMLLRKMGAENGRFSITVPKRFSDGYGINERMVDELPDGALVITVDNGIAAIEPVRKARERWMKVLIMDHHLSGVVKPEADLIIDPEDNPKGWTFHGYCGAGLVFKLAEYLYPEDKAFLDELSVFAMIATVGDCVDIKGDGRNIVLRGLDVLNKRPKNAAMQAIADKLRCDDGVEVFTEYEVAFKIAPMMNAPGRLRDEGGKYVVSGLFSKGEKAEEFADELYEINKKRKELVKEAEDKYEPEGNKIRFLYIPDFEEGLCGILAGHICGETHVPAFVMTDTSDGLIKGSARSEENANVFEMMGKYPELFVKKGGHAQAAGFSLKKENIDILKDLLESCAPPVPEDISWYDFETDAASLEGVFKEMEQIGVFGEGLEKPVLKVRARLKDVRIIGADKTHLSMKACAGKRDIKCIAFSLANDYARMGMPKEACLYGTLSANYWNGRKSIQFQVAAIEEQ